MAEWTIISDTVLEPGKPARSVDALAFRDNPIAIAEGAAGAPSVLPNVGSRTSAGGVGTYAFMKPTAIIAVFPDLIRAGSGLEYTNHTGAGGGATASGTWRCMGSDGSSQTGTSTLWVRIS